MSAEVEAVNSIEPTVQQVGVTGKAIEKLADNKEQFVKPESKVEEFSPKINDTTQCQGCPIWYSK